MNKKFAKNAFSASNGSHNCGNNFEVDHVYLFVISVLVKVRMPWHLTLLYKGYIWRTYFKLKKCKNTPY